MSDPVQTAQAQNTSQATADLSKTVGQDPTATPGKTEAAPAPGSTPDKATEPPKADPAPVEEKYELKNEDGTPLDAAKAEKIVSFAKENKLSSAQAQAIFNRENAALTAFQADQENQYNQRKSQWVDTLKADKEFGGEKFETNSHLAHNAFKKFADPEFAQIVENSGLGNHPGFVKLFYKLGKAMEGDSFVQAQNGAPEQRKPTKSVLYDKK
jgi:hypothetical protein